MKKYMRFHCKMDGSLVGILDKFAKARKCSRSALINEILEYVYFMVEKKDLTLETDYLEFPAEIPQNRDIYFRIERKYKRKMFQMQDHFNLRSKGSLLRFILRLYFARYNKKLNKTLTRGAALWHFQKMKISFWEKVAHMSHINQEFYLYIYSQEQDLLAVRIFSDYP